MEATKKEVYDVLCKFHGEHPLKTLVKKWAFNLTQMNHLVAAMDKIHENVMLAFGGDATINMGVPNKRSKEFFTLWKALSAMLHPQGLPTKTPQGLPTKTPPKPLPSKHKPILAKRKHYLVDDDQQEVFAWNTKQAWAAAKLDEVYKTELVLTKRLHEDGVRASIELRKQKMELKMEAESSQDKYIEQRLKKQKADSYVALLEKKTIQCTECINQLLQAGQATPEKVASYYSAFGLDDISKTQPSVAQPPVAEAQENKTPSAAQPPVAQENKTPSTSQAASGAQSTPKTKTAQECQNIAETVIARVKAAEKGAETCQAIGEIAHDELLMKFTHLKNIRHGFASLVTNPSTMKYATVDNARQSMLRWSTRLFDYAGAFMAGVATKPSPWKPTNNTTKESMAWKSAVAKAVHAHKKMTVQEQNARMLDIKNIRTTAGAYRKLFGKSVGI